jgi:hypothetical protein
MQLTVMPCGARSRAAALVKPTSPALPVEIDVDNSRPFFERGLRKPRGVRILPLGRDCSVVDEDRNLFPTLAHPIDETGRIALSRHIYCLGKKTISVPAEEIQRSFHVLGASRHKCDAVAASQKAAYDCKAYAACSSGHKGNGPIALTHLSPLASTHPRACSHSHRRQWRDGRAHGAGKAQRSCSEEEVTAFMLPHPAGEFGKIPEFAKRDPNLEQAEFVKRQ